MKTPYNFKMKKWQKRILFFLFIPLFLSLVVMSCIKYDEFIPEGYNASLVLSVTDIDTNLYQKGAKSNIALALSWTTGSNNGTGAAIVYELQLDLKSDNFVSPISYTLDKGVTLKSITVADLNDTLLNYWNLTPEEKVDLEARIVAHVTSTPETTDTSNVLSFSIIPYLPVSTKLYMVGDATPNGWDIANADSLTRSTDEPTTFTYKGPMKAGHFKFPVNRNTDWAQDMYMRDPSDSSKMILHHNGEVGDYQWEIYKSGLYKITVNLCDLTISIVSYEGAEFSAMYMVGDATSAGWDISNAVAMTPDEANPNVFRYNGVLEVGDFKFPVNRNTDWGQDMFMRDASDSTKVYRHTGGASDDSKWHIYKAGWYDVVLDVENLTISYKRLDSLYIVGSATTIGWTITNAIALTSGPSDYEFTFNGLLNEGEFKFPFDRSSSWGQNFFMKNATDASKFYFHLGGSSGDDKWTITSADAGNYEIVLNVKDLTINMVKQ